MIRIFYGDDRKTISEKIKREFGDTYEVLEGNELCFEDLPSIFLGNSLFCVERKILIKDFSENKVVFEKIVDFLKTTNNIILWETKLDKRTTVFKKVKESGIEVFEYKLLEKIDSKLVFDIFDVAFRDGERAVKMLEKIENEQDPFMLVGLFATQAIKKFEFRQGNKEKRVLSELSKLDIKMKSTSIQPWLLLKSFLLELSLL